MRALFVTFLAAACLGAASQPTTDIRVNQVGYLPAAPKLAMVAAAKPASEFTARNAANHAVVFKANSRPRRSTPTAATTSRSPISAGSNARESIISTCRKPTGAGNSPSS